MDQVEKISDDIKMRVDGLGAQIIRFADEKKRTFARAELSDAEKRERIDAARDLLRQSLDAAFGDGDGSIRAGIRQVLDDSQEQAADTLARAQKAAGIWLEELPGLRQFLEYCSGMIEEHPGEPSPKQRASQKCLTEATVVLDRISGRVKRELSV